MQKKAAEEHSNFQTQNLRFPQIEFCIPREKSGQDSFSPYCGTIIKTLPDYVIPSDIPTTLLTPYVEQFATQPEACLTQFLEANPNFSNPRDLGRILFHTPDLSPYGVAIILFDSQYSSPALTFSFITAIDLDYISIVDAMRYIFQKVAVPTRTSCIKAFASAFSTAYGLRNRLEWPYLRVIYDIFCATICFLFSDDNFHEYVQAYSSLKNINETVIQQIGAELTQSPPAIFFSNVPIKVNINDSISDVAEQEGRYRSSWKTNKLVKEGEMITVKDSKDKIIGQISTIGVIAKQRFGVSKRPFCLTMHRFDNAEFGTKIKGIVAKPSRRTAYSLAFKKEEQLMRWISSINTGYVKDDLRTLY
ncbi:hypothetical protein GPJ56_004510 [Histomonas meleagridis]|uniref:uncharacterized protein n=1 Tax=Histomonas meleagridis TaxID=135588 RepID=UPI00355A546E|nr:hypothetical protein GPJ56_004510 [Histomonas meleagridis]KAH0803610.1 hypothetical protein GO595_003575 [Histomonas meleagridis]